MMGKERILEKELNTGRKIYFSIAAVIVFLGACIFLTGCNKPENNDDNGLSITGVSIPSVLDVTAGEEITLTAKGFKVNDEIHLKKVSDPSADFVSVVSSATDDNGTFALPEGIISGGYTISVTRGEESLILGSVTINITTGTVVPDITGMTIKGIVYCDGAGIPGVVVSDGIEVTVTDSRGIYYLPSDKKNGFVFISIPGDYEAPVTGNVPQFFKKLAGGSTVERIDFPLFSANNQKHVFLVTTDWHLANRNDDLAQFGSGFVPDINATINGYESAGTKVYGLAMGDMTWDLYWYENNFRLPQYLSQLERFNCPFFSIMGNHDNDPYIAGDIPAEASFRSIIGPTYYSFNLGDIHYIVLDDIQYVNSGGAQGVIGDRSYYDIITSDQMIWLERDLATISDKTRPVIVAMHAELYTNPTLDGSGNQVSSVALGNGASLVSAFQGFSQVHILSGHTHINYTSSPGSSLMEHNTAAVSATWWWTGKTGYAGNHICKDGSPGGYGVWESNGKDVKWYYKGIGKGRNYQFRTYDLNQTHITAARFAPGSTDEALAPYAGDYSSPNINNQVLINVWGFDPGWTIEVREGTTPLVVERVYGKDPLHIISYEAKRLNAGAVPTSSFVTSNTAHLFRVTASSATSTLEIKVTDRFGTVSTETMTRPKEFNYLMN